MVIGKSKKITPKWFKGKKVTVFGIGVLGGGVGTIKYLAAQGAHVIATDIKTKSELAKSLKDLEGIKNIEYVLGSHRAEDFSRVDMVIKTPASPWTNKHVKIALEAGIPVETDASLFLQLCSNKVIGVTGTKGKTTTSRMIEYVLQNAGKHVVSVGIGQVSVLDRLALLKKDSIVVFELSSWRLSALKYAKVSPHIAVFTNFFPDHMNYYKTLEAYMEDKAQILIHQKKKDFLIYSCDDRTVSDAVSEYKAKATKICATIDTQKIGSAELYADDTALWSQIEEKSLLIAKKDLHLTGAHNHINALLAIGALQAIGMSIDDITKGLTSFSGVRHRLEYVDTVGDVDYVNDSAATNPTAAIAAIESFHQPIILLAGGADKKLPSKDFAAVIYDEVKDVVFFKGQATDKLVRQIKALAKEDGRNFDPAIVSSMQEAFDVVARFRSEGDVVLLSPGAASFGVFKNEFDRGDQFRGQVNSL